jgi:small conductance mechanosensitive channel
VATRNRQLEQQSVQLPEEEIPDHPEHIEEMSINLNHGRRLFLKQRSSLHKLYSSLLFWLQWLIWMLGISYLTYLFFWTRPISNWITGVTIRRAWSGQFATDGWPPLDWLLSFGREATLGIPLFILLLVLISRLTLKIGDTFSDIFARTWFENTSSQRYALRVPTFARILKGWLRVIVYLLLGIVLAYHLQKLGAITQIIAVFLGFISFALSLASQNLLRDLINGLLILWEDQYAVGDVILVDDQGGLVEKITLRVTQLRNLDGELITIPNGSIGMVRNLSNDWSRVNYAIEVDYETDVDKVLGLMEEIAEKLYQDPEWQDKILSTSVS